MIPKLETIRSRTFELLNPATFGDQTSRLWDQFFSLLILLNVIAVTLESVETLHEKYDQIFHYFELFSILIFTVEYSLRVWVAPLKYENRATASYSARVTYVLSVNGIIDLLSIIPFYLQFILPGLDLRYFGH